ncbi:MAG: protein translocase subunit SecD [Acidobacteriaceae bacterium]
MGKNLATKAGFIIAVLVIFIYGIFGIPHGGLKQSLLNRIHLGLDLKGGTHLVLKVHTIEAINSTTDRDTAALNTALTPFGANAAKLDPAHPETITVTGGTLNQSSDIRGVLTGNEYSAYDVASANGGFTMTMKQAAMRDSDTRTVDVSMEAIRQRIDSLGVAEPHIEKYGLGENQILVELPGVTDLDHVRSIIQSTAKLEIHEVVGQPYESEAAALAAMGGTLPFDEELVRGSSTGSGPDEVWVLKRASIVEGTDFRDAQPSRDENGRPDLTFNLTTEAGDRFYKYTDSVKGTGRMAIVLENKVKEVAGIESAIRDSGRITGGFTQQQAQDLSMMLRTGSLPASIEYTETRTVGPSLGAASIRQGVIAAVAGMSFVMVFMLVYYRGAGINADLALVLNLVLLLGFMGFSGATLTLPGIAGVILTIGMGVDSNVLIFERIREELRLGKTSAAAIQEGFAHAWVTIIDTHVTTIVSAAILFILGTGPVKGFAVTLTIGLLANLFTAVFVSRTIFDYLLSKRERTAALSI